MPWLAHKTGMPQRAQACTHHPCTAAGHTCLAGPVGCSRDAQLLGGDGTPWVRGVTRHRHPLIGQSHSQRWGWRHSTPLGPFLICFNHDNMIYFIYKYPSGTGNNVSDDIFQMVSCSWARRSPGITSTPFRSIFKIISRPSLLSGQSRKNPFPVFWHMS